MEEEVHLHVRVVLDRLRRRITVAVPGLHLVRTVGHSVSAPLVVLEMQPLARQRAGQRERAQVGAQRARVDDELKKVMEAREAAESEIKALQLQAEASQKSMKQLEEAREKAEAEATAAAERAAADAAAMQRHINLLVFMASIYLAEK